MVQTKFLFDFHLVWLTVFIRSSELAIKATEPEEVLSLLPHQAGLKHFAKKKGWSETATSEHLPPASWIKRPSKAQGDCL